MSASGQGYVFRPKYRGADGQQREARVWHIGYSIGGKKYRESSKSRLKRDAVKLLTQRLHERGRGLVGRDIEKVMLADLVELIRTDYRKNRNRSAARLETSIKHLTAAFGGWRVVDVAEPAIDSYTTDRLDEGAAAATVNREMAALRRMFRLGLRAKLVTSVPIFTLLKERNVRQGFVEAGDFAALLVELPPAIANLATVGYLTGWRTGELLSRDWRHVDLDEGWIRLDAQETKNGRGRMFPLIPQLREVLEAQLERRRAIERTTGQVITPLFFRDDGKRIRDFRGVWKSAAKAIGQPNLLFHDLRRTAARNLVRAGIPAIQARRFTGHETLSIFDRYAISDETSMWEAGEKYAAGLSATAARTVIPIERAGKVQAKYGVQS